MVFRRGWVVTLDDGTIIRECDLAWNKVPKNRIKKLALIFEGRVWELEGKEGYFQYKRGSASPGERVPVVEKRCIGYYEDGYKIEYIVDERTGIMNIRATDPS